MANFPIRNIGDRGIISDRSPYDLPPTAWSSGLDVRFNDGTVSRYSVFRKAHPSANLSTSSAKKPVGIAMYQDGNETEKVLIVSRDSSILEMEGSVTVDVSPSSLVTPSDARVTSCHLGGVTFINRSVGVPLKRGKADTAFAPLSEWDADDRCRSLGACQDFLIALNVTKDTTHYPGMVKWSNAMQLGVEPDWDTADPASLAGENILNDVKYPLIDGKPLGNSYIIYSNHEVYRMDRTESALVWTWEKLFDDDGMISANACVEVEGKHYVFGSDDIYVHDGISRKSITKTLLDNAEVSTVRKKIFGDLDFSKADRCHVTHDADQNEILFHYPSTDAGLAWQEVDNANVAAVYNYVGGTWTFVNMPNTVGGVRISTNESVAWGDMPEWPDAAPWNKMAGKGSKTLAVLSAGDGTSDHPPKLLILDTLDFARSNKPVDNDLLYTAMVERTGLDLDEIGAELIGRKLLRRMLPQLTIPSAEHEVLIQLGHHSNPGSEVKWGQVKRFDPTTQYKYDTRNNGRYLAIRIYFPAGSTGRIGGYDLDLIIIARR